MEIEKDSQIKSFNLDDIYQLLKRKKKLNQRVLIQITLPKIDGILDSDIDINFGPSNIVSNKQNYFETFGILHELTQIFNKKDLENRKSRDFFFKDILNKKEINIDNLAKLINEEMSFNKQNIKGEKVTQFTFDFGHKDGLFIEEYQNKSFKKGSEIKNITYCYNINIIPATMLELFLLSDKELGDRDIRFIVKFPSIISSSVSDVLRLLSSTFNSVKVFKSVNDSMFKDSFHVICEHINKEKYNIYRNVIRSKTKDVDLKKNNLKSLLVRKEKKVFEDVLEDFSKILISIIYIFISEIIKSYQENLRLTNRDEEDWKVFDYYYKY